MQAEVQMRDASGSRYSPAVWQVRKHLRVGRVLGSPKYPPFISVVGQTSMQTRVPSQANDGDGHIVTHSLVIF